MADLREKATYGVIGVVVAAIINLGVFAMKADVADLETRVYQNFSQRDELNKIDQRFDSIDKKIDKVIELIINRKGV